MAETQDDVYNNSEKDTTATGRDLPQGDGTVSDEDMEKISGGDQLAKTGQDHSTEDREDQMPTDGVGAIPDSSHFEEITAVIDEEK